ncbi:MAG: hypothetical protein FWG96_02475 [Methanomassiliicoccaceae archaeon]|nr:hypothetical protein [Methanomassiliicoccaceae archaeon]
MKYETASEKKKGTSSETKRILSKRAAKPMMIIAVAIMVMVAALPLLHTDTDSSGEMIGDVSWASNYGGTNLDIFSDVTATTDGGCIAVGYSSSALSGPGWSVGNNGSIDALIMKFDSAGNVLWASNYGGTGTDTFASVTATIDGGFVAVGNSQSPFSGSGWSVGNNGWADLIIFKFDSAGNVLWANNYGGTNSDYFSDVTATADGGCVAVGSSDSTFSGSGWSVGNNGWADLIIFKFDSAGNVQWASNYGGTDGDEFSGVTATTDGGCVAVGNSNSTFSGSGWSVGNNGLADLIIFKFDSAGNVQWASNYGGTNGDSFGRVTATTDGGCIVIGHSTSAFSGPGWSVGNNGSGDAIIMKFLFFDTATINASNKVVDWNGSPQAIDTPTVTDDETSLPLSVTSSDIVITYTGTGATTYGPSITPPTDIGTYSVEVVLDLTGYWAPVVTVTLTITPGYAIDIIVTGTGSVTVNDGTTMYGPFTASDSIFVPTTTTSVTFTAVSAGAYWFEKFIITPDGGTPSTYYSDVLTASISSDMEIEVRFFTGAHFTITEGTNIGDGKVQWSIDGTAYYDIPAGGKTFPVLTSVYLKAAPNSGWTFSYWIGVVEASDTYTHSASSDLTVAAAFVSSAGYYDVFVTIIGSGDVEIYDGTTTHVVTGPGSTIVFVPDTVGEITITAVTGTDVFEYSDIDSGNVIFVSSVKWPISADMTVDANFLNGALFNYYAVDVTVAGNGIVEIDDGTNAHTVNVPSTIINIPQSVLSISIEAFPGIGYEFEKYVIDSADNLLNPANVSITGDMSVTAVFTYAPPVPPSTSSYNIKATSDAGSTISPSGTVAVTRGASQTFHFAAAAGYHISEVIVDGMGLSQAEIDLGYYTFRNVNMSHSIEVRSAEGGITLEIRITGSGHAEYSVNGAPFAVYGQPVFLTQFSDLTLTAYPVEGYKFIGWKVGSQESPDSTISFDNVMESMVVYLIFEKDGSGGSAGGGLFGGADSALWWIAAAAILLLAAGALFWFLFFWRRAYDVIKVQSSASIIGKDKARRNKPYEFTVEGSGQAAYRVGEDGVWKPVPSGPGGEYVIPKNDVTDTLTIEVR